MAAPSQNTIMIVDKLAMMFPTIERPTIQNILTNECHGDTTKSIVILTRIQQFNTSMKNVNNNNIQTNNSGEANISVINPIQSQQIPLSINNNNNNNNNNIIPNDNNNQPQQEECCRNCCQCCSIKPASYSSGLYNIDYKMYNISYLLFSLFTIYPESTLYALSESYQGLYLPTSSLILLLIASLFMFFKRNNKISDTINCIRGSLFIFGGLLYFLGYIIHSINITDICDNDNGYYGYGDINYAYDYWDCSYFSLDDITPEPEYLIGRGIFVGFHAIFIGLLYVSNNTFSSCFHSRNKLIRCWTLLFFIFSLLVLCWIMYPWYYLSYMAFAPIIILITLSLNCCLIKKSNESGGCTSGVSLGLIIVIAYYFSLLWFVIFIIFKSWIHEDQQSWYLFWDLSILLFGAIHLWILSRAMSPVNANCGCNIDGSGDGNVVATNNTQPQQPQQPQPQQVVMVIQQPPVQQQQVGMMPIVTTASISDKVYRKVKNNQNEDDEGDDV